MFGQNPQEKKDHGNGQTLHIVAGSPFLTIQGEGPYIGHPAVFMRLHGCHLKCHFCDTNFSDPNDPILDIGNLLRQIANARGPAKLVIITGGEPLRQNILPICIAIGERLGMKVQIETAGTFWIEELEQYAEIICSPKTPTIHPMIFKHAKAFKYVVDSGMEFDGPVPITATQAGARPAKLAAPRAGAPIYLSPMDVGDAKQNKINQRLVGELALKHYGCIAGIQLHKIMGLD